MELTKDDIIKQSAVREAQKLFLQYGFGKTTMDDIARAIGKGKSSLYYYFATKEELYEAVLTYEKSLLLEQIAQAIETADTAEEKLKKYATVTFDWSTGKKSLLLSMLHFHEQAGANACIVSKVRRKYNEIELATVKEILHHGVQTGELRARLPREVNSLAVLFLTALKGLMLRNIFDELDKAEVVKGVNLQINMMVDYLKK